MCNDVYTAENSDGVPPEPPYALSGLLNSGLAWLNFGRIGGGGWAEA